MAARNHGHDIIIDNGKPRKPTSEECEEIKKLRAETKSECPSHLFEYKNSKLREYCGDKKFYVRVDETGKLLELRKFASGWCDESWMERHWKKLGCPGRVFEDTTTSLYTGTYIQCQTCGRKA